MLSRVKIEEVQYICKVLTNFAKIWHDDNDWMKKCMEYEVKGARPRGRPKKTWREIVEKDCQECGLNREDAMIALHG